MSATSKYAPLNGRDVPLNRATNISWLRGTMSATVVALFVYIILFPMIFDQASLWMKSIYKELTALDAVPWTVIPPDENALRPHMPDFTRYGVKMQELNENDLHFKRKGGRLIFIGDVHGMKKSLDSLIAKLHYNPVRDQLIHTGDTITRGPTSGSFSTLSFLASHNVSGVRGNHDQKIVEWRAWFEWVLSFPDGKRWLDEYVDDTVSENDEAAIVAASRKGFPIPTGWKWASEHWHIARKMTSGQYNYLLSLPLVLHIPSLHVQVVHAGLLPVDPTRSPTSRRQPLSHIPILKANMNIQNLRAAQEAAVFTDIPQNQDPWTVLNIRSIKNNGGISRQNTVGHPWAKLWNQIMKRCSGFLEETSNSGDPLGRSIKERYGSLNCYPFTIVYGHSASRGLDLKKWSKGLDSGCVYGGRLSSLVYSETDVDDSADVYDDMEVSVKGTHLGDNVGKAKIVSVRCLL